MIEVGDIVYQTKRGWSSMPMVVLDITDVKANQAPYGKAYRYMVCEYQGWAKPNKYSYKGSAGHPGTWSDKWQAYIDRYTEKDLSLEQGNAV